MDSMRPDDANNLCAPKSLWALFVGFTSLAIQGFGGAAAVAFRELVERRRWLTAQEFAQDWAVAQLMPGPNAINLSLMVGDRFFGARGAAVSLAGMLCLPVIIAVSLATLYNHFSEYAVVSGALKAMGAVAAGLIIGTAIKLLTSIERSVFGNAMTLGVAVVTFVAVGLLRWPLIWVLIFMCVAGTWWAHRQLTRRHGGRS